MAKVGERKFFGGLSKSQTPPSRSCILSFSRKLTIPTFLKAPPSKVTSFWRSLTLPLNDFLSFFWTVPSHKFIRVPQFSWLVLRRRKFCIDNHFSTRSSSDLCDKRGEHKQYNPLSPHHHHHSLCPIFSGYRLNFYYTLIKQFLKSSSSSLLEFNRSESSSSNANVLIITWLTIDWNIIKSESNFFEVWKKLTGRYQLICETWLYHRVIRWKLDHFSLDTHFKASIILIVILINP